jgi:hypothetical protein
LTYDGWGENEFSDLFNADPKDCSRTLSPGGIGESWFVIIAWKYKRE